MVSDARDKVDPTPAPDAPAGLGLSRRRFVLAAAVVAGTLGAGIGGAISLSGGPAGAIGPADVAVRKAESRRQRYATGRTVRVELDAAAGQIDLAGKAAPTWMYSGTVPGPLIKARPGDQLEIRLRNRVSQPGTVHWHGLRLRNDMDGVPNITQSAVPAGGEYTYSYIVPDYPGTYWYHSHVGVQRARGLYGALVVDDPADPGGYDQDVTLVLDDWIDGLGYTPDDVLARLQAGQATGITAPVMDDSSPWGPMVSDVTTPLHLINGKPPGDPFVINARKGQRLRLRLINAGSDRFFKVALGGHRMTVTHADGYPVEPVQVDTLIIDKGERYDVTVVAGDGVFPLVAQAVGSGHPAWALLRTAAGSPPPADALPPELQGRLLDYADLVPAGPTLPARTPDRVVKLTLAKAAGVYKWVINGQAYDEDRPYRSITPITIRPGERLRLVLDNASVMTHPMHLHGHTFALAAGQGGAGVLKDTVAVRPSHQVAIDVEGDNPGQWIMHCHNEFHMMAGMATILAYRH